MGAFLRKAFVATTCISAGFAVDVSVQNSGGNATGKFGHPYGYGFLHEVDIVILALCEKSLMRLSGYQQFRRWWHIRRVDPKSSISIQQEVQRFNSALFPSQRC